MPSSLTSTKIKDTYGQVLHVDGGVTTTPKTVYDGDGTATALKVSTTDVQVNNSPVLTDADIGSTVQAYDADLTAWSGKTAPSGTVVGTSDSQALSNKTFSDNPVFSAGTANGVAYLNGSKVLTTGSALTFDGSNLGLGVTPSAWARKAIQIGDAAEGYFVSNTRTAVACNYFYDGSGKYIQSGYATLYESSSVNGAHAWFTAPSGTAGNAISFTQAMTLDASGNLLVGTTSGSVAAGGYALITGASSQIYIGHATGVASGTTFAAFQYNGTNIGSITQNGTTAVAYNTTSDHRLKENIQPMQNALGVVAQLNPVRYTWKADGSDGQGFIAHELQAVVPDCVTGEKDAVDEDGKPVYQGVDTSFLVGILTKAIQELKAELDATKAEVAALKAIN